MGDELAAGHFFPEEAPGETAEALIGFFETLHKAGDQSVGSA